MILRLYRNVLYVLLFVSLLLSGLHFKYQFKLSDLHISISFSLDKHKTDMQLFSSSIRLTNLLSTSRSSIRWFSIATWANSKIVCLLVAKPTKQRAERSYYFTDSRASVLEHAVAITLFAKFVFTFEKEKMKNRS